MGDVIDLSNLTHEGEFEAKAEVWLDKCRERLDKDPELHLGGWVSEINGVPHLYLDLSKRYPKEKETEAKKAGKDNNQRAIWHIDRMEEIPTGGTGEKTKGGT